MQIVNSSVGQSGRVSQWMAYPVIDIVSSVLLLAAGSAEDNAVAPIAAAAAPVDFFGLGFL